MEDFLQQHLNPDFAELLREKNNGDLQNPGYRTVLQPKDGVIEELVDRFDNGDEAKVFSHLDKYLSSVFYGKLHEITATVRTLANKYISVASGKVGKQAVRLVAADPSLKIAVYIVDIEKRRSRKGSKVEPEVKDVRGEVYARYGRATGKKLWEPIASYLDWLRTNAPGMFAALMPLVDYNPVVTYHLLFEPHTKQYKLEHKYLSKWWDTYAPPSDPKTMFSALVNIWEPPYGDLDSALQNMRSNILVDLSSKMLNRIREQYNGVVATGCLEGETVFGPETMELLGKYGADYLIALDDLRLRADVYRFTSPVDNDHFPLSRPYLLTPNSMSNGATKECCARFANTTLCLYLLSQTPEQWGGTPGNVAGTDPSSVLHTNVNALYMARVKTNKKNEDVLQRLMKLIEDGQCDPSILDRLKNE